MLLVINCEKFKINLNNILIITYFHHKWLLVGNIKFLSLTHQNDLNEVLMI